MLRNFSIYFNKFLENPFKTGSVSSKLNIRKYLCNNSSLNESTNKPTLSEILNLKFNSCSFDKFDQPIAKCISKTETSTTVILRPFCRKYLVFEVNLHLKINIDLVENKEFQCKHCKTNNCQLDALYLDVKEKSSKYYPQLNIKFD